jgi:hypothetical protein
MGRPVTGWWGWEADPVIRAAMACGASQDPWELAEMLAAVRGVQARTPAPELQIVEIGCDRGGTLYAWRTVTEWVYGVTLADNSYESGGSGEHLDDHGAAVVIGDSHEAATRSALVRELRGGRWSCTRPGITSPCGGCDGCRCDYGDCLWTIDVLVIDGDHSPEGVVRDLEMYGPLVAPGGLIALHDITETTDPRSQVWRVWPGLAAAYDTAEIRNPDGGFGWGLITVGADGFDTAAVSLAPGAASPRPAG